MVMVCACLCTSAIAQHVPLARAFRKVEHLPGLADRGLAVAVQDSLGRVWFGSWEGLFLTNGVTVAHFVHDPQDSTSIAGRNIEAMVLQDDRVLWLATENGPCGFDTRTRKAMRPPHPDGIDWPQVTGLHLDERGGLWIASSAGPMRYDTRDATYQRWPMPQGETMCYRYHEHPFQKDRLLIVGARAIHVLDPVSGNVVRLSPPDVGATGYKAGPSIVHAGALWMAPWSWGVRRYDLRDGSMRPITYPREDGLAMNYTGHLAVLDGDHLWVGTQDMGVMVLNVHEPQYVRRHTLEARTEVPGGTYLRGLLTLHDGTTLLCSDLGLFQLTRPRFESTLWTFPDDGRIDDVPIWVSAFAEHPSTDELYIGTYDGLGVLKRHADGSWQVIGSPLAPNGRPVLVNRLLITRDGSLWAATRKGLLRMPGGGSALVPVTENPVFCRSLFEDDRGRVWVGTAGEGVMCFDGSGELLERFRHEPSDPNSLISDTQVRAIAQDTLGRIWFGTHQGLSILDPPLRKWFNFGKDLRERTGSSAPHIYDIARDSRGGMWVSRVFAGIRRVVVDAHGVFSIHAPAGSKLHDRETTHDFTIDDQDRIWVINMGVDMLDTRTGDRRHFSMSDGLLRLQTMDAAIHVTRGGLLLLGVEGEPRVQVFDTRELLAPDEPAPIEWTRIADRDGDLPLPHDANSSITLAWAAQPLLVQFAAIDLSFPFDHRYQYRLLGLDSAWADLGTERAMRFAALAPGDYTLQVRTALEGRPMDNVRGIPISILAPWYKTTWARLGGLSLLAFALLIAYRLRVASIRRRAAFQRRLAEVEMQALRAQMNPHFLFNSLNSIKYYALTKDPRSTADYLGKFALLIRKVLHNSRAPLVPLRDELEALRLYVDIEAMRLEDKFARHFEVDPALDLDAVRVPPMLLQPYVENAIWHGLMNREGHGELRVAIARDGDHVLCVIEDDGVGRAKAEELKQGQGPRERSFGMRITAERMELTAKAMGLGLFAQVDDLVDAEGGPAGTRVTVRIPITLETTGT